MQGTAERWVELRERSGRASAGGRSADASRASAAIAAVLALLVAVALLAPLSANAATVSNGGFETGSLSGWLVQNSGSGNWFAYSGTTSPVSSNTIAAPPQGSFAAVTDTLGPGTHILYQDVGLEPAFTHKLSLIVYYRSSGILATPSPDSLDYTVPSNEQYRIEVMKPSAPLNSVNPADILLTVFRTRVGDPLTLAPTAMTADLTPFGGQTVRLRLAEVDNLAVFNASADAASLTSTPISNVFSFGKLKRNKHRGTAILPVNVPGPGTLSLTGKGVKTQRPGGAVASKVIAAAGTVKLLVKPKGSAKHKLNKTGKVKVKVKVTFTPTGGASNTQTKRVKLIKTH
jgi:hypothetical protein